MITRSSVCGTFKGTDNNRRGGSWKQTKRPAMTKRNGV